MRKTVILLAVCAIFLFSGRAQAAYVPEAVPVPGPLTGVEPGTEQSPAPAAVTAKPGTGQIAETDAKTKDNTREEKKISYILQTKKNGDRYILQLTEKDGKKKEKRLRRRFVKVKQGTYYVNKTGIAVRGWRKINKKYYFFDRKTGKMHTGNSKVDGISFYKNGAVKMTEYNIEKIKVMMRARKVVEGITSKNDTKGAMMKKCFKWIFKFPYRRYRIVRKVRMNKGWELEFANDMFVRRQGCCVSNASAFAFLAKECGYKEVYLCDDTGHGWTEINGRAFDPLFAEARDFNKNYNVPYGVYRLHPVGKKRI